MGIFSDLLNKEPDATEQTKEEKDLAGWIKEKVEEIRNSASRSSHESIWLTNIAYLLGYDSVFFDSQTKKFTTINRKGTPLRRDRLHVNRILPTVQNRLARLCKSPPKFEVRPSSQENEDKDAARKSYDALIDWNDRQKINQKRLELYMWMQQCGHSYGKITFDDMLGKEIVDPTTNELSWEGEVRFDAVSAFEVFVDPLAKVLDEAQYLIHAKVRKLDYFKTHYEKGNLVEEEEIWLMSAQYQEKIQGINASGGGDSNYAQAQKGSAMEIAYYEKRSKKYPQGRMVIIASGIVLEDKALPCGEIPFAKFDDVIVAGKFYSESLITHGRPIQDQINRSISMRADWSNKLLAGKYAVPKGHGMSQESMNNNSGEIVEYNPQPNAPNGGMPVAIQTPNIPQFSYEEEERLVNSLYDIFGINQIARGQLPAAGIPAIGMQLLLEQDETRIGIETEQNEHAWAHIFKLALKYMEKYYKTPREYKKLGKNSEYQIEKYTGDDFRGNTDVIVIRSSTVPTSVALRRQGILNLYDRGLVGDPADPKTRSKVLADLEYGDLTDLWKELSTDQAQIRGQIEQIEKGEQPMPNELDNHSLHIQEKNMYRKGDKFKTLSPENQSLLVDDIEMHIQFLMKLSHPELAVKENADLKAANVMEEVSKNPEAYADMVRNAPSQEDMPLPPEQGQ